MHSLPLLHLAASPSVLDLVAHLWQSTAVALAVLLLLALCGRLSARTRRTLGWMALMKFALPAAWLVRLAERITDAPMSGALVLPVEFSPGTLAVAAPVSGWSAPAWLWPVFMGGWMAGSAVLFAWWLVRGIRVRQKLLAEAKPVSAEIARHVANAAARAGLRASPRGVMVASDRGPGAVGIVTPILILPAGLAETLSQVELEAILIHECVHLRRRDNLWNALRAAFVGLLWFNPIVWLLNRVIGIETEKACDERVVEITGDAGTYANSIVASVRHTLGVAQPGWSAVTTPPVVARLKNILAHPARRDRPLARWAALLAGVGLVALSGRAGSIAAGASTADPSPVAAANAAPERAGGPTEDTLSVDFPDEEIRNILRNVANLFKLNLVIPETLQGRTTINLRDVTWRQIFKVVLDPIGYGFVEDKNVVTIVPKESQRKAAANKVGRITIKFVGAPNVTEQMVRSSLKIREGGEFDEVILDRDIRSLYRTGHFESIEVKYETVDATTFNLVFQITPRSLVPKVQLDRSQRSEPAVLPAETPAFHRNMVFELRALDQPPVAKFQARPKYPYEMRRAGIGGEVVVDFIIDANGDVTNAYAIRSSQKEFESAAVQAVGKWKFTPGRNGGRAVNTHSYVTIVFAVNEP